MCSLRDAATDLQGLDARVFGVSFDGVAELRRFHEEQRLGFPLLSDPDGSAAEKLGVPRIERQDLPPMAARVTVIVDGRGRVRWRSERVDVMRHGAQLADAIEALRREDAARERSSESGTDGGGG